MLKRNLDDLLERHKIFGKKLSYQNFSLFISLKIDCGMFTHFKSNNPGKASRKKPCASCNLLMQALNGVLLLLCSRTNSESQCRKVIHKKSVGKAGNSNFLNFPLSPLIFYVFFPALTFRVRPRK